MTTRTFKAGLSGSNQYSISMKEEFILPALDYMAKRGLPARLDVTQTAGLLGFADHEIPILVASHKLTALGNPAPNAPKWFATIDVLRLISDHDWLHKATLTVSKYWQRKRERRTVPLRPGRSKAPPPPSLKQAA